MTRYGLELPPPDPRQAVRTCCGDTHWGPEPIDYPCPEELCPHGFYAEGCGDCRDAMVEGYCGSGTVHAPHDHPALRLHCIGHGPELPPATDSHVSVSPEQTPSPDDDSAHSGEQCTVPEAASDRPNTTYRRPNRG